MPVIGNNGRAFIHGLSDFWLRFFKDLGDLETTYEGMSVLLGQTYLNMLSDVLNTSVLETPLFKQEYYRLITIREDQLTYVDRGIPGFATFKIATEQVYGSLPHLQNKVFAPTTGYEEGLDYVIQPSELHFKVDPTEPVLNGVPSRDLDIVVTGAFSTTAATNWAAEGVKKGDTLVINGSLQWPVHLEVLPDPPGTLRYTVIKIVPATATVPSKLYLKAGGIVPDTLTNFTWRVERKTIRGDVAGGLPHSAGLRNGVFDATTHLRIQEIALWAVDAQVDDDRLYAVYGHFFDYQQPSSEAYRTFIRGLMQLYILGPNIDRIESALNVMAGLPVIRDDGEVLSDYDDGITAQGADGSVSSLANSFTTPSFSFSLQDVGGFLELEDAANSANIGTFQIIGVANAQTVFLLPPHPFVSEPNFSQLTPITWTYSRTNKQTVTTTRQVYEFPRHIPMLPSVVDPVNFAVLTFRAFDVLTTATVVTDYIKNPEWWINKTLPASIFNRGTASDRILSPHLRPNVIGEEGGFLYGDPGFYFGADENGPPAPPVPNGPVTGSAFHHNAAFIVMDRFLKTHILAVTLDRNIDLSGVLITQMQEVLVDVKPAHTTLFFTPFTEFNDLVGVEDLFNTVQNEESVEPDPDLPTIENMPPGMVLTAQNAEEFSFVPIVTNPSNLTLVFSSIGVLPAGLNINPSTGEISGAPSGVDGTTFGLQIRISCGPTGPVESNAYNIEVFTIPTFGDVDDFSIPEDAPFDFVPDVVAHGFTLTFSMLAGTLPPALILNTSTGEITGTPADSGLTSGLRVRLHYVRGSISGNVDSNIFGITVFSGPSFSPIPDQPVIANTPFSFTPTFNDAGFDLLFSIIGTLPSGLTIDELTGEISGESETSGLTTGLKIRATFNAGADFVESELFDMEVFVVPSFTSIPNQHAVRNVVFAGFTPTVSNPSNLTLTFALVGGPIPGLSLNVNTGAITGTPSSNAVTSGLEIELTHTHFGIDSLVDSNVFTFEVFTVPTIAAIPTPQNATVGTPYDFLPTVNTQGFTPVFSITGGSLPSPLVINTSTGEITGTPTGTSNVSGLKIHLAYTHDSVADSVESNTFNLVVAAAPVQPATQITIASGDGQVQTVNQQLVSPFVVTVRNASNAPVSGVSVTWAITNGAGSLTAINTVTNGAGQASTTLTMGTLSGDRIVQATSAGLTGSPVSFNSTATPDAPVVMIKLAGDNQEGSPNTLLPIPLAVQIQDQFTNGVPGLNIVYAVSPGSASLGAFVNPTSDVTNSSGASQTQMTLGNSSTGYQASATSGSLSVTFNEDAPG